ncbi:TatD family hydrolase [Haloferula sp. A504]|uniref:TatD family hydrolase n=1 Tax=Haloferula sp. A504 TaxID=3373601 RepID=UPI0031C9AA78|nr:TatD family hydrolase [Verrucomicrobiaceae bacterium E54]
MALIDAHNHLHQLPDPEEAIRAMRRVGIEGCVVNGTSEDDWPAVAELAEQHPDFIRPAFGLHPWHAHQRSDDWLDTLQAFLDRFPGASIGECGVDRWIDNPPIELQLEVFLPQLALARERNLPITIHALKAWGPLLDALDQEPPPERGFLLHSYGGSPELVAQLLPLGARFSFSGHFLHPRKTRVVEAFRAVPPDRLLLETDAPSMPPPEEIITHSLPDGQNHPANLPAIATGLARHLSEDPAALIDRCTKNTRQFLLFT